MRRARFVPLLLLLAACGGGTGTPVGSGPPSPAASEPTSPGVAPSVTVSPAARHGGATVTYRGTSSAWAESACETTRGTDGAVVGWMATFQDADEQAREHRIGTTESARYVQLRVRGYTGNGSYAGTQVSVRFMDRGPAPVLETAFGAAGQALTLRDGGHEGRYRGNGLAVDFDCDPADDTSTKRGQAVPQRPAPGTAYVVRPEGATFRFTGVRCGTAGSATEVLAGGFPHFVRLRTPAKSGGGSARVLLGLHGAVVPLPAARVELAGAPLASGTFGSGSGGAGATRGAFACGS